MSRRILIRCDFFAGSGAGHLKRCRVLAEALRAEDLEPVFVLDDDKRNRPVDICYVVETSSSNPFDEAVDAQALITLAARHDAKIVIGDSYRISENWVNALKASGLSVVVIDDLGIGGEAHVRIDYSPTPKRLIGAAAELLGPSYFLTDSPCISPRSGAPKTLVAHAGWTGDFSAAAPVYNAAARMAREHGLDLTWITPDESALDWLRNAGLVEARDRVIGWQKDRRDLWSEFDVVVGPASTSLFEAIMQGAVPVSFPITPTQSGNRGQWLMLGHPTHLTGDEVEMGAIVEPLVELAFTHHAELRNALNRFAAALDGKGAARAAAAVAALADGCQPEPTAPQQAWAGIRPCDLRDAHTFLSARNAPHVRALSTDPKHIISWPEHLTWWVTSMTERFVVEGEHGPEAFFWHCPRQMGDRHYLIGGWFPADDQPVFATAIRLLDWQLAYCAVHYPNHVWLATIHKTNRAVLKLNQRYGFAEADTTARAAVEHLFPGVTEDFAILQREACV